MKDKNYYNHESSVIDEPVEIGEDTKIWHFCHIMAGAKIGTGCSLGQNVYVGGKAIIGNNVKIQNNVSIYDGVELYDNVFCGPSMVFTNDTNPRSKYPKDGDYKKTVVREGASIGANVTIVCGVQIGVGAFIGAGTVITKDVPDYAIIVGVPGKQIGWMCECGTKLNFTDHKSKCGNCDLEYQEINNVISLSNK